MNKHVENFILDAKLFYHEKVVGLYDKLAAKGKERQDKHVKMMKTAYFKRNGKLMKRRQSP